MTTPRNSPANRAREARLQQLEASRPEVELAARKLETAEQAFYAVEKLRQGVDEAGEITMTEFPPEYKRAEAAMIRAQREADSLCVEYGFLSYRDWYRVSQHLSATGVLPPT